MSRAYKCIVVVPAGRRRYLEILVPQILRQQGWDELHLWMNTNDREDIAYMRALAAAETRIRCIDPAMEKPDGSRTIGQFFRNCVKPGTVYIRFDDDICWIEEGLIDKLARFRVAHPEYFLVMPIVINNAISSYVFQVLGRLRLPSPMYIKANCMDDIAWRDPHFAKKLHTAFLAAITNGSLDSFRFESRPIAINRFSINCICWLGDEFARFGGIVSGDDEEEWLSVIKPTELGKANLIFGGAIAAHFAFHTQREVLDASGILDRYKALAA